MHAVHADVRAQDAPFDTEMEFVHGGMLQLRIDDVDPGCAGARKDETGERIRQSRRKRRQPAGRGVEKEDVASADLDRQRAAVEPAFERLNLQDDAVVVDAVAAAHEQAGHAAPGKADPRREVVEIALALASHERLHDRVQLAGAALVVDVGVDLVTQAHVQLQLVRHAPVVLDESGDVRVVGVRQLERLRPACRSGASPQTTGRCRRCGRRRWRRSWGSPRRARCAPRGRRRG